MTHATELAVLEQMFDPLFHRILVPIARSRDERLYSFRRASNGELHRDLARSHSSIASPHS
jgi:hypothetical protein